MIYVSSSDSVMISASDPSDRDEVERTAEAALQRGAKVTLMADACGKKQSVCTWRPYLSSIYLSLENGTETHPLISSALVAGLRRFDTIFDEVGLSAK